MKVVFVEGYPGFRGAQRSLAALARGVAAAGVEVEVWCTVAGRASAGYAAAGLTVRELTVPPALRAFGGELARLGPLGLAGVAVRGLLPYTRRLVRELRASRPAVVHCNELRALLLAGPAARLLGLPVVWHQRGLLDAGGLPLRLAGRLAGRVICVSEAVRGSLPPALRRRATVVRNGVGDGDRPAAEAVAAARRAVASAKAERGLDPGATVLVTASSFLPYKGLHHLASALGDLARRRPALELLWLVLGDAEGDPQRERYRAEVARRAVDAGWPAERVWWVGWRDDAAAWIAAADLAVLPTVAGERFRFADGDEVMAVCSEGFPRTVLEAMLAGTPVVATDVAGVREQIADGDSGVVVPPGDPAALAAAVERLAADPELRRRLAAGARRRVGEELTAGAMVEGVLGVYRRLVTGPPSPTGAPAPRRSAPR